MWVFRCWPISLTHRLWWWCHHLHFTHITFDRSPSALFGHNTPPPPDAVAQQFGIGHIFELCVNVEECDGCVTFVVLPSLIQQGYSHIILWHYVFNHLDEVEVGSSRQLCGKRGVRVLPCRSWTKDWLGRSCLPYLLWLNWHQFLCRICLEPIIVLYCLNSDTLGRPSPFLPPPHLWPNQPYSTPKIFLQILRMKVIRSPHTFPECVLLLHIPVNIDADIGRDSKQMFFV